MTDEQAISREEVAKKVHEALDGSLGSPILRLIRAHNILQRYLVEDTGAEPDKDEPDLFMPAGMKAVYDAVDDILGEPRS